MKSIPGLILLARLAPPVARSPMKTYDFMRAKLALLVAIALAVVVGGAERV